MFRAARVALLSALLLSAGVHGVSQDLPDSGVAAPELDGPDLFADEFPEAPWVSRGRPVQIGLVFDDPFLRDGLRARFRDAITELTAGQFEVRFPDAFQLDGKGSMQGIERAVAQLLAEPGVDIVLALGVMASTSLARLAPLPKPGIAAHIVDADVLGIPMRDGTSGVRNLAYVSAPSPVVRDLQAFREVLPFENAAVLISGELLEHSPELRDRALRDTAEMGIGIHIVPVGSEAGGPLAAIPASTDLVYLAPLLRLPAAEFDTLAAGLVERKLPSLSLMGVEDVRRGVLATLHPETDNERMARRVALNVQRILFGERPEALPVLFAAGERLTINMATARAIGFSPSWAVLAEAVLINEEPHDAARAHLKPRLEAATTGLWVHDKMAGFVQPERSWDGTLTLQQVVYDERAHANLEVSKRMQRALEHGYAGQELDIIQIAAQGYFNVLRAKTFERIQQDNLRLTRGHLELARVRQNAGSAGPGEVYRWESELALRRIGFTDANALRASAEIDLNRILNQPQEDVLATEEAGIDDELLAPTRAFARAYLDTPRRFGLFRDFIVREGLERAPELQQLDEAIAAQERVRTAAHRAYYVPSVGVQDELKRDFLFGGQGAGGGLTGLFMPALEEDTSWNIAVRASLPLYAGGAHPGARDARTVAARARSGQREDRGAHPHGRAPGARVVRQHPPCRGRQRGRGQQPRSRDGRLCARGGLRNRPA